MAPKTDPNLQIGESGNMAQKVGRGVPANLYGIVHVSFQALTGSPYKHDPRQWSVPGPWRKGPCYLKTRRKPTMTVEVVLAAGGAAGGVTHWDHVVDQQAKIGRKNLATVFREKKSQKNTIPRPWKKGKGKNAKPQISRPSDDSATPVRRWR